MMLNSTCSKENLVLVHDGPPRDFCRQVFFDTVGHTIYMWWVWQGALPKYWPSGTKRGSKCHVVKPYHAWLYQIAGK
jgi:hypothetical protein